METGRMTVNEYLDALGGNAPAPGGGGASAVAAALAASCAQMVASLSIGKKKFADIEDELKAISARFEERRNKLIALADKDAEVFEPLSVAYKLPTETEEQKAYKAIYMEDLLENAAGVPLDIMQEVFHMMEDIRFVAEKGSRLALSDAGNAAALARAVLANCLLNVRINTKSMMSRDRAGQIEQSASVMYEAGTKLCNEIYMYVGEQLWK